MVARQQAALTKLDECMEALGEACGVEVPENPMRQRYDQYDPAHRQILTLEVMADTLQSITSNVVDALTAAKLKHDTVQKELDEHKAASAQTKTDTKDANGAADKKITPVSPAPSATHKKEGK